jgi:ATP-dependent Clp protease protease subunit
MTASAPYYGDSAVMRTPPPDLPSLLLKERIVYLGLPLFSDDPTPSVKWVLMSQS